MRLLTIVGVNAIIGIGWLLFANWTMRCSQSHGWVSSFVEVSFALNIALSIRRVSEECIKPVKELVHRKINERIRSHEHKLSQEVFVKFKDSADVALTRFEDTELPKLTWCVRIAQITSFLALVMLLGCDVDSQWIVFVPALKLPPIWFFVTFHIMALQSFLVFVKELDSIRESESLGENADMTQLCRDMNFGRIRSDFRKEQKMFNGRHAQKTLETSD